LIGLGASAAHDRPVASREYRRGYLCGLVRGDGTVGDYIDKRRGTTRPSFRLALADIEALSRAREYLALVDILTHDFLLAAGSVNRREIRAIRNQSCQGVSAIRGLVEWPRHAEQDWMLGFLAGIFDAEGNFGGVIRITNTDQAIIDWTCWCLRRLGFAHVVEQRAGTPVQNVRLTGGLGPAMRFFQLTDPAIGRKRSIEGRALKAANRLAVQSIEPLPARRRLFDITTGTGDFIANGVVSHNCFARPTHTYLDLNAREDFEREIVVKVNVPERVRADLRKPSWKGELVALGTNTDPYQWVESRYRLTRGVWEAMRDYSNPCSVLTKSPLLLRDLDLFRELVERTDFSANLSIPTLDEKAWRQTEPHTPHPRTRLEAVAELTRNGIPSSVLIAPLMPGINDSPEQVERILELAADAGARNVTPIGLHLRGEVREIFFDWLRQYRPDLLDRYEELYRRGAYLPREERKRLARLTRARSRAA
jgi:DNA repair photolyase